MPNPHVSISTDTNNEPLSGRFFHELPHDDEERLEHLFNNLDVDGNGKIDIHDLSRALQEFGVDKEYAKSFLERADVSKSSDISLAEFIHYVKEHEKNLKLGFSHIDKNRDGKIDLDELIKAFQELGVEVEEREAKKLLERMDKDGSLEISYNEWRDFLLYAPYTNIHDLIRYWKHTTYMDMGEDLKVPDDFTPTEIREGVWWKTLIAGGVAGTFSRTATAPIDRIKVVLQVHGGSSGMGVRSCCINLLKEGGFKSMWRGNGINVIKIAPESALKFCAYETAKGFIRQQKGDMKELAVHDRFLAGAIAGVFSQSTIYPMEVLKTRLAIGNTGQYNGLVDATIKIYKSGGLMAFYKGYIPNTIGIIPYAGIDLAVYETMKNYFIRRSVELNEPPGPPGPFVLLASGTMSGTAGMFCSYPLSLIRTRLQAQMGKDQNFTLITMARHIYKEEGPRGFYRGITANFIKVAPSISISYIVYEKVRELFHITPQAGQ